MRKKVFIPEKRYCITCGNELNPAQRIDSKFCSEKYAGKKGHKCRNDDSNPRNHIKNKIKKITGRGLLFDIMPFIKNNQNEKSNTMAVNEHKTAFSNFK